MPNIVMGGFEGTALSDLKGKDLGYKYPNGLNLKPGSELHEFIRVQVMQRANESHTVMSARHVNWGKIDRTLTAYIPLDKEEKKVKDKDERKPVSIVVPVSYAVLDTMLAYWMATFLESPYFKYAGQGPEDTVGAILLEKVIELHCLRLKVGLSLYTMWRDSLAYGIGVVAPIWHQQMGIKTRARRFGFFSSVLDKFNVTSYQRTNRREVLFEGNKLINVDPYNYLPDPNTPIQNVQDGEFVGFVDRDNYMNLLEIEQNDDSLFNIRYLKGKEGSCKSKYHSSGDSKRSEVYGDPQPSGGYTKAVDTIYMYINLIPKEWKLGSSEYPERWLFGVSGDEIVTKAQPLGLNHGLYPLCLCAPTFDGHSVTPIASLEIVYGMQEVIDWLLSSHIANVRKAINDMVVVDPSMINYWDVTHPKPGKVIRLRRAAYGKSVKDAIFQLNVTDVTARHMGDITSVLDLANRVIGTSDAMQGVMRHTSERKTATEFRGAHGGAISRSEKDCRIVGMQAMYDISYMFAMHTQQLMSEDVYVKSIGKWEEVLAAEYGPEHLVKPWELMVDYDVIPQDGSVPSGEYVETWTTIYSILAKNPELMEQFDMVKIFNHVARLMGAKNIGDFAKKGGQVQPQVGSMEEIDKGVKAGNLVPMEDLGA